MGQDGGPRRSKREGRCDCQRRSRACWTAARHVPALGYALVPDPRPPAQPCRWATAAAQRARLRGWTPTPRARARESGHLRAPGPRSTSAFQSPRSSQSRASVPRPGFEAPSRESRGRAGLASPAQPAHGPCAGTYRARPLPRERVPRGSMALPDPRSRPRRLAAPPRKWTPAARPARPAPGAGLRTPPGREEAPRPQPRAGLRGTKERAQDQASGGQRQARGVGGAVGTHLGPQDPTPNLGATGEVGGPHGRDATAGAAASACLLSGDPRTPPPKGRRLGVCGHKA